MGAATTRQMHILVLGTPEGLADLPATLLDQARLDAVSTFDEAMIALRQRPYDLVITRAADFLPFNELHFSRQAAAIIDSVSQGLCIIGAAGRLDWANPRMLNLPETVRERVLEFCAETFRWAEAQTKQGPADFRGRRFSITTQHGEHYEVTATPVIDMQHRVTQVAAVIWDATNAERLQDKIEAIDRAGRELLSIDAAQFSRLDAQERLHLLEQKILRCIRDLLHFDNFEVRILDRESKKLDLVLGSGFAPDADGPELYAAAEGSGICGYVAARGRSYICPDATRDPRYVRGIEHAQSSLTVPLWLHDRVVGVANFESTRLAAFNEDDRQFAEIFGRYVALSLHMLELLASERRATTGKVCSNVVAEVTGPLNDLLTDLENLVEDYIGLDDLRHRLRAISDNAIRVRNTLREITAARPGVIGVSTARRKRDDLLENKRILVADDESILRETIRDVLTGYGCQVSTAADGAAAIELVTGQSFDLVLSDIKMPHKTGYDVFAAAKEANPKTPVILTTGFGYDPNHSIVRARREGLAAVLFKPFKVDQLLNEIRSALKAASAAEA